eukprot:TRINITY_DN6976_c0_g1_i1.p1 TRINITY_DN6976_c0_g1~~TRINITY_DN6976_c0_g1_i1.p1  ORF type:complete len:124 (-),score=19.59 TRINITY_DN6976_c0_g1_i1:142-513(-)
MWAVVKKGPWTSGLFDIQFSDCLKQACLASCVTLPDIHEKLKVPNSKYIAVVIACLGCACCELIYYGKKFKGLLEPLPVGVFKAWCCASCYLHQQTKEPAPTIAGAAGSIANAIGAPNQEEMA